MGATDSPDFTARATWLGAHSVDRHRGVLDVGCAKELGISAPMTKMRSRARYATRRVFSWTSRWSYKGERFSQARTRARSQAPTHTTTKSVSSTTPPQAASQIV